MAMETITPLPYFDRPDAERLALSARISALGNGSPFPTGDRCVGVAIARDRLGETNLLMAECGFKYLRSYYFPLGSDKPSEQLRHDSEQGGKIFPRSVWLFAVYS